MSQHTPEPERRELYEKCRHCGGSGVARLELTKLTCHFCEGDRFVKVGLTVHQVQDLFRAVESLRTGLSTGFETGEERQ